MVLFCFVFGNQFERCDQLIDWLIKCLNVGQLTVLLLLSVRLSAWGHFKSSNCHSSLSSSCCAFLEARTQSQAQKCLSAKFLQYFNTDPVHDQLQVKKKKTNSACLAMRFRHLKNVKYLFYFYGKMCAKVCLRLLVISSRHFLKNFMNFVDDMYLLK